MGTGKKKKKIEKGRNKVALLHGETGAHTCRTDTNKTGNENVLQGKAHREQGDGERKEVGTGFIYCVCVCLEGRVVRACTAHISCPLHVCNDCPASCDSQVGGFSKRTDPDGEPGPPVSRVD